MASSTVDYRERNAQLPDMGSSGLGPRTCTPADVEAVLECGDLVALAHMRGYARSYFATGGGIVMGGVGAVIGALAGRRGIAVASALVAGGAALVAIEARRRARQWESAIDTAIARALANETRN